MTKKTGLYFNFTAVYGTNENRNNLKIQPKSTFCFRQDNELWIIGSWSRVYLLKLEVQRPVGAGVWPSCLTGPIEWPGPPQRGQTVLRHGGPRAPKREKLCRTRKFGCLRTRGLKYWPKKHPSKSKRRGWSSFRKPSVPELLNCRADTV
jgi:hypothetical protein